jgi:hypothetical protein
MLGSNATSLPRAVKMLLARNYVQDEVPCNDRVGVYGVDAVLLTEAYLHTRELGSPAVNLTIVSVKQRRERVAPFSLCVGTDRLKSGDGGFDIFDMSRDGA